MLPGILIGIAAMVVLGGLAGLVVTVVRVGRSLREAVDALRSAATTFSKTGDMGETLKLQVATQRRTISAIEGMNATIKVFNGLMLASTPPTAESAARVAPDGTYIPATERRGPIPGRTPITPPVPSYEQFAVDGEADVFSRTEEELGDLEAQAEARAQGIEVDPLMAQMPTAEQIRYVDS